MVKLDYDTNDSQKFKMVKLQKIKVGLERFLAPELLSLKVEMVQDILFNDIRVCIRGFVWSEGAGTAEVKYPRDWWQALKERFFPDWAKRRWPVIYKHYRFDAKVIYPDFRPAMPEREYCYQTLMQNWDGEKEILQ